MSFPGKYVQRSWHLVDATNQRVGRLANQVAILLHGKHKPTFRPNGDMGDHVVIINADKVCMHVWLYTYIDIYIFICICSGGVSLGWIINYCQS